MRTKKKHMGYEDSHNIESEKNSHWETSASLMEEIKEAGGFSKHARNNKDSVHSAFSGEVHRLCCMDGRIHENGARVAGSGILLKDNLSSRERFIAQLKKAGVKEITLHVGCGAVAEYARRKGKTVKWAEKEAEKWAQYLAKRLDGEYREDKIEVYPSFHNERVIYYDLTGNFNPSNASDVFPPGFVISRKYIGAITGRADTEMAMKIAKGEHGYGKRFDRKNPLLIVIVANSTAGIVKGRLELTGLVSGDVKIQSFVKPK